MFLDKLKRSPARGRYIPELDGLRFLAILGVVFFHAHVHFFNAEPIDQWSEVSASRWFEYTIGKGYFGVQLFFVISGFIIAMPFAKHHLGLRDKPKLKNFYIRRFKRIEIPYFITLSCSYLWLVFAQGATFSEHLFDYLQGMTYTFNFFNPDRLNPILHPAWTLELEIQFYLLAPLLCLLYKIKHQWVRICLWLGGMLVIPHLQDAIPEYTSLTADHTLLSTGFILTQLPFFFAGMLALDLYLVRKKVALPVLWDLLGITAAVGTWLMLSCYGVSEYRPFALCIFIIAALWGNYLCKFLSIRLFTLFGGISYSIYLFHGMILHFCVHALHFNHWSNSLFTSYLSIIITVILTFLLTIPFYLLIERPFMRKALPKS